MVDAPQRPLQYLAALALQARLADPASHSPGFPSLTCIYQPSAGAGATYRRSSPCRAGTLYSNIEFAHWGLTQWMRDGAGDCSIRKRRGRGRSTTECEKSGGLMQASTLRRRRNDGTEHPSTARNRTTATATKLTVEGCRRRRGAPSTPRGPRAAAAGACPAARSPC